MVPRIGCSWIPGRSAPLYWLARHPRGSRAATWGRGAPVARRGPHRAAGGLTPSLVPARSGLGFPALAMGFHPGDNRANLAGRVKWGHANRPGPGGAVIDAGRHGRAVAGRKLVAHGRLLG